MEVKITDAEKEITNATPKAILLTSGTKDKKAVVTTAIEQAKNRATALEFILINR